MALALEGIKVIDVSQVVAVPMAARFLGDFGADVIHVENPETGDSWRTFQAGTGGRGGVASNINYNWEVYNRNKKSMTLDLSKEEGKAIIHKLIKGSDVFITNLRLWEQEKFGVEYQTLREINPELIYGSVTGYGKKGPERNAPAYDVTAGWWRGGIQHMLSLPGMPNVGFRSGFADSVAALSLVVGVMMALHVRDETGVGQEVETSLFSTGIYLLAMDMAGALVTGRDFKDPPPPGAAMQEDPLITKRRNELIAEAQVTASRLAEFNNENMHNPLAANYSTKDDRLIHLNCLQPDRYWSRMCRVLELADLERDARFASIESRAKNRVALYRIMKEAFKTRTLAEWKPRLDKEGIPYGPQQKLSEVINDPQAEANNYFPTFDHPAYGEMKVVANPVNLSETPASIRMAAPEFSQHTEEILLELGYTWEDIGHFKEQKIIA